MKLLINIDEESYNYAKKCTYNQIMITRETIANGKPLEQEPRKGRWIKKYHADEDGLDESCSAECSSCHKRSNGYAREDGYGLKFMYYDFCPKCGSDNREVRKNGKRRSERSN